MKDLRDAVVVVTGASGGLGSALSHRFAAAGAKVALVARRPQPLAALAEEIATQGGKAFAIPADITASADRSGILDVTRRKLGEIDVVVNVASIVRATRFLDEDPAPVIMTNLLAPIALTREILPSMLARDRGHILNIASLSLAGLPYLVDYSASKAGFVAFSTALREELRGTGVSATVVSPGFMVDRGAYVPYETPVPWYLGSNTVDRVAKKAIRAMQNDRAEVIANRMPVRPLLVVNSLSERAFRGITGSLGLRRYLRSLAERGLDYDGSPMLFDRNAQEAIP